MNEVFVRNKRVPKPSIHALSFNDNLFEPKRSRPTTQKAGPPTVPGVLYQMDINQSGRTKKVPTGAQAKLGKRKEFVVESKEGQPEVLCFKMRVVSEKEAVILKDVETTVEARSREST